VAAVPTVPPQKLKKKMLGMSLHEGNDRTAIIFTVAIFRRIFASYLESQCLYANIDCPVGLFSFDTATVVGDEILDLH
jgi:hypothetical protein